MELTQIRAMETEYAKWLDLVEQLKATGAVTEADGNSPLAATETAGQRLYQAIREWGESLVVLRNGEST